MRTDGYTLKGMLSKRVKLCDVKEMQMVEMFK